MFYFKFFVQPSNIIVNFDIFSCPYHVKSITVIRAYSTSQKSVLHEVITIRITVTDSSAIINSPSFS